MKDLYPDDPNLVLFSKRFTEGSFDPTAIRPIVSPVAQTRPKLIPSTESYEPSVETPPARLNANVASPKRPFPLEESDNESSRPQKLARTTRDVSPLKGAAGRRLDQQKRTRPPQEIPQFNNNPVPVPPLPPPLPRDVMFLLSIIPKSESYHATKFSAEALVRLIRETNIPNHISQLPPPPGGRGPPPPQPPQQKLPIPMQPPIYQQNPMQPMPNGQYVGQFNGGWPQFPSASPLLEHHYCTQSEHFP